jgi:hypothetical protein
MFAGLRELNPSVATYCIFEEDRLTKLHIQSASSASLIAEMES